MTELDVACEPGPSGWSCAVRVGDDAGATRHRVTLTAADLERLKPGAADPIQLIRESFEFLLEREPRESILRSFALPVIGRYFPDYEARMRERSAG